MATIFHVPRDAFISGIIPYLPSRATYCFGRVSKIANEIVQEAANASMPDITLAGKSVGIIPGSVAALLRQKVKIEVINLPEFPVNELKKFRMIWGNNLPYLLDNAFPDDDDNDEEKIDLETVSLTLTPYDFVSQLIPAADGEQRCLGEALIDAILRGSQGLVRAVFSHPNAVNIPADGDYGLGDALTRAVMMGDPGFVRVVLSHPNAINIPEDGDNGLGAALGLASRQAGLEMVRMILFHPNAGRKLALAIIMDVRHIYKQEIVDIRSAFVNKHGNLGDAAPLIPPDDKATLLRIKAALGSEGSFSIIMHIKDLSSETQLLIYMQLCQAHGNPTRDIVSDGIGHIQQNPQLLLSIIDQLI